MTIHEWAAKLNGREYREEMTKEDERQARADGVVVVFGRSDDLVEFLGAIDYEDGGGMQEKEHCLTRSGLLGYHNHPCECAFCGYADARRRAAAVISRRDDNGWWFTTLVPHATFIITEDNKICSRGLVFALASLPD